MLKHRTISARLGLKRMLAVSAATAALAGGFAVPATAQTATPDSPAAREVPCDPTIPYTKVYSDAGDRCFADGGVLEVRIDQVSRICSGNNNLNYGWRDNPDQDPVHYEHLDAGPGWEGNCRSFTDVPGNTTIVYLALG
ncbi:beta/gamma crystallin domain-containing protein [Streptomyces sp. HUAS TT7]|uniref:beta/gamma crystallin domain-containing protein n=1 Tax=Streptomyces sp. HUAS TT7 TaxID=3447507 RepID=UPI003F656542